VLRSKRSAENLMTRTNATSLSTVPAFAAPRVAPDLEAQRFTVSMARSPDEVKEAQRLRHRVFVQEMGAQSSAPGARLERDRFDPFCRHLIVRDSVARQVVGTYRILTPERAAALGAFMAEREFDLTPFAAIRGEIAEVGRACIDAGYRSGSTIMLLWSALAAYALAQRYRFLFGCVCLGFGEGWDATAAFASIPPRHLAPPRYRVLPRSPLPHASAAPDAPPRLPALLKGYLRAGAWVCGEPAWDSEFRTADLLVLLPLERVEQRYARHFLRDLAPTEP
jgi:putative hemolysin